MNPLLFADWSYIHRVFRRAMWLVATVLVFVIWYGVALRAPNAHSHPATPTAKATATQAKPVTP